jgi:hypothetical protein
MLPFGDGRVLQELERPVLTDRSFKKSILIAASVVLAAAVIPPASAEQVATPQLAVTPIAAPAIPAGTSVLNIALPATQTAG